MNSPNFFRTDANRRQTECNQARLNNRAIESRGQACLDYAESSRLKSLLNCRGAKEETPEGGNDSRCPEQITAEMIPLGEDLETVKQRSKLLKEFYDWWLFNHPERKVQNTALNEDISVTYLSKHETSGQAARRYKSALAVLKLDYILENALPILSDPADKKTKAQKKFERMLLMKCDCEDLGIVKLTVGVYKDHSHKEQYCITVIEADSKDSFKQSKKHGPGKKNEPAEKAGSLGFAPRMRVGIYF